jgi:DNA-binding IclR family transcriptional regulator
MVRLILPGGRYDQVADPSHAVTVAFGGVGLHVGLTGLEHVRSSGKAVLAHLDDERRERILRKSLSGVAPA